MAPLSRGQRPQLIVPHSHIVEEAWHKATRLGEPVTFETRFKRPWIDPEGNGSLTGDTWMLVSALPTKSFDGTIRAVNACITDISLQKSRAAEAHDRAHLSEQILLQKTMREISEQKFSRIAELAPVGIFIMTVSGEVTYANSNWFQIVQYPRVPYSEIDWRSTILPEDDEIIDKAWATMVETRQIATVHHRRNLVNEGRQIWVSTAVYPELNDDGQVEAIMGCITDVSNFKQAEIEQKIKAEEALESKRQQENFIDMTSHEMRNPLSAVIQSADTVVAGINSLRAATARFSSGLRQSARTELEDLLTNCLDAAQTIASCSTHQKNIVNDILTLSKLDAKLLLVTPIAVQPVKLLENAQRMFKAESQNADVSLHIRTEQSFLDVDIDWLMFDPSRLLQVLINLTSNALKFTRSEAIRNVTISLSAYKERPSENTHSVHFIPTRTFKDDFTTEPEWGTGEIIYLQFSVQDSGRGLTSDEMTLLFTRFSQASPRTHVQYGGSGLGLFISRELTELQGGEIGVTSQAGAGSTFSFYIMTRRAIETGSQGLHGVQELPNDGKEEGGLVASNITILIVEDNLINQAVLRKQLLTLGYNVVVANHGGEALAHLQTTDLWKGNEENGSQLSIVLMDIEMPVQDGLTCTRNIRQLERTGDITKHVPIIAVSANARIEQVATARESGMDDVISKPFRISELIPKIERLLRITAI